MVDNRISLQQFADGGAQGAQGTDGAQNASGLTGDFEADFDRYFGSGRAAAATKTDGEKEQPAQEPASAAGESEGEGAASSGQTDAQPQQRDKKAEFDALRKGEYKDEFGAYVQGLINERFKANKQKEADLQKQIDAYRKNTAALLDKYGLPEDATPEQIGEALQGDNTTFARQAMAAGKSVDAYRDDFNSRMERQRQEAEQKAQREQEAARQEQERRSAYMSGKLTEWNQQAEKLREQFPSFDLAAEIRTNEQFGELLKAGLPVDRAYYAANFEKISSGLVAAASRQAAKRAAETVAANQARPPEGGQAAGTGVQTVKRDVNSLTGKDIDDILRRVARGERIAF